MGYCVGMDYVKGEYIGTSFDIVNNKEEAKEEVVEETVEEAIKENKGTNKK